MYIGINLYCRWVEYINLSDIEFFQTCIEEAKQHINPDLQKDQIPVIFASKIAKQTDKDTILPRKKMYDNQLIKRSFIMLDIDYNPDQQTESEKLYERVKLFASKHETPVLIYPTISFPDKPRYRIVLFTTRLITARQYNGAIHWLALQLDYDLTDASDKEMSRNRNLPAFTNQDQVDHIYSTLDNSDLKPLNPKLWQAFNPPAKKHKSSGYQSFKDLNISITFNETELEKQFKFLTENGKFATYEKTWPIINSIALAIYNQQLSPDVGENLIKIMASCADDELIEQQWIEGNKKMLTYQQNRLETDPAISVKIRPLETCFPSGNCYSIN